MSQNPTYDPVQHAIDSANQSNQQFHNTQPQQTVYAPGENMPGVATGQQPVYTQPAAPQAVHHQAPPQAQHTPANYGAPAVVPAAGVPAVAGPRLGFGAMAANKSAFSGDCFISVAKSGIEVKYQDGDTRKNTHATALAHQIIGTIDTGTVQFCRAVKWQAPGKSSAEYDTSYDGINSKGGKPWPAVVAQAMSLDNRCRGDYSSAEFTLVLTEDVKATDGRIMLTAGESVMHSLSTTNYRNFEKVIETALADGLVTHNAQIDKLSGEIEVQLDWYPRSKNGNTWGLTSFTLLEPLGDDDAPHAAHAGNTAPVNHAGLTPQQPVQPAAPTTPVQQVAPQTTATAAPAAAPAAAETPKPARTRKPRNVPAV